MSSDDGKAFGGGHESYEGEDETESLSGDEPEDTVKVHMCSATDNSCKVLYSMTLALSLGLFPICLECS